MTLYKRRNSPDQRNNFNLSGEPYLLINIILTGVIVLIFVYSGFFSPVKDNYPVVCIHEQLTGQPCISCGLSHSFSLILRGKLGEALTWNIYGLRIFLFFALQLIMRIAFSVIWKKNAGIRKQVVVYDIGVSVLIFLISFWPFIINIFGQITHL
jgi:hypothetical protein